MQPTHRWRTPISLAAALSYGYVLPVLFLQSCCLWSLQDTDAVVETPLSVLKALIGPDDVDEAVHSTTAVRGVEDEKRAEEGSSAEAADLDSHAVKALISPSAPPGTSTENQGFPVLSTNTQFSEPQWSSLDLLYGKQSGLDSSFSPKKIHHPVFPLAPAKVISDDRIFFQTTPSITQQARNVLHNALGLPISSLMVTADGRKPPLITPDKTANEYHKLLKRVSRSGKNRRYGIGSGGTSSPWWTKHDVARNLLVIRNEDENLVKVEEWKPGDEADQKSGEAELYRSRPVEKTDVEQSEPSMLAGLRNGSVLSVKREANKSASPFESKMPADGLQQQLRHESSATRALIGRLLSHVPVRAGKKGFGTRRHKVSMMYNGGRKARRGQETRDYYVFPQESQRSSRRRNEQMRQQGRGADRSTVMGVNAVSERLDKGQPYRQPSQAVAALSVPDVWIDEQFDELDDHEPRARGSQQHLSRPVSTEKGGIQRKLPGRRLGGTYDYYLPQAYDLPMSRPVTATPANWSQPVPPTYTPFFPPKEQEQKEAALPTAVASQPSFDSSNVPNEDAPAPPPAAAPLETVRKSALFSRRRDNAAGVAEPFIAAELSSNASALHGENRSRVSMLTKKRNHSDNEGKKEHVKKPALADHHKPENRRAAPSRNEDKQKRERSEKGKFRQKKSKPAGKGDE